jgi:hypothetical protein
MAVGKASPLPRYALMASPVRARAWARVWRQAVANSTSRGARRSVLGMIFTSRNCRT